MKHQVLGTLVGNTGEPHNLHMVLNSSFSGRRGEFVRIRHQERQDEPVTHVLGRIVSIQRTNMLFNSGFGNSVSELELLPGAEITGEHVYATIDLVGYKDATTNQIKIPRRPLDPGSKVETVDYQFLSDFYEFNEQNSLHIGNLVGYEHGENTVPVYLDVNKLVTEHMAILAMTGSGKSYTVGRIIERLVALNNGTVVVFDPHGEYGRALQGGNLQFGDHLDTEDERDKKSLPEIKHMMEKLQASNAGIQIYTPQMDNFRQKYANKNKVLALQFDKFEMDDISEILPGLTEPQQRVLDVAIRYWRTVETVEPRDINKLRFFLGDGIEEVKKWDDLSSAEAQALNGRSAAVASMKLSRVLNEAQSFYSSELSGPTDIYEMIGRPSDKKGRLVVIDLQGLSDTAKQVICGLLSSEILRAASSKTDKTRPSFLVYEEGHNFAPAGGKAVSHRIIKKIAGEGRKFGVGFGIVSQRPSKLDADVTSQCNTLITMRLKNPDDQRFITKASDMVSKADLEELPSLSTGEALICGRSIPAPLLVKVGSKALVHGGESPEVLNVWGTFSE
ncbi:AAA-like domain protein [Pseudoalteromonas sp. P1-13-1a]|uniref:ATP-binding protein n=1 Tax=Pseudoalteromonas sp. P1-13-1a TaxID=1723756 RepID=UPI0006D6829F|nr:ATP-binding protein [Pseudoalteromonas sp. P1-13-1a]KPZ55746.1 AAA-like domain protein [Pseudoalteromonas sp. P1-13-1a]